MGTCSGYDTIQDSEADWEGAAEGITAGAVVEEAGIDTGMDADTAG